jgi:amidase
MIVLDEPDVCEGMPTHVQIMGKPMMDEELIEIMKVIESVMKDTTT